MLQCWHCTKTGKIWPVCLVSLLNVMFVGLFLYNNWALHHMHVLVTVQNITDWIISAHFVLYIWFFFCKVFQICGLFFLKFFFIWQLWTCNTKSNCFVLFVSLELWIHYWPPVTGKHILFFKYKCVYIYIFRAEFKYLRACSYSNIPVFFTSRLFKVYRRAVKLWMLMVWKTNYTVNCLWKCFSYVFAALFLLFPDISTLFGKSCKKKCHLSNL